MSVGSEVPVLCEAECRAALHDAHERYRKANPKSLEAYAKAREHLPGGNTRTSIWFEPFPLTLISGSGGNLRSVDGDNYVDFLGDFTVAIAGHNHPAIQRALVEQTNSGWSLGGRSQMETQLAALLSKRFPPLEYVRFTNSGTEANLIAISAALAYTGRRGVMVFRGGYHGSVFSFGAVGGALNAPFEFIHANYNDLDDACQQAEVHRERLGCIIVEPMLGGGGCIKGDPHFLNGLAECAKRIGAILIFDEVMTSRIGASGMNAICGVKPDMMTVGKYIGGGLSFGAFGGKAKIMEQFDPSVSGAWNHAGTFNNNVFTLAAALAMLSNVYSEKVALELTERGDAFRTELNELADASGLPVQVTGCGSMMNVHFVKGDVRSPADAARSNMLIRDLFFHDMLARGVWIARRGMTNLSLCTGPKECARFLAAFSEFLESRRSLWDAEGASALRRSASERIRI